MRLITMLGVVAAAAIALAAAAMANESSTKTKATPHDHASLMQQSDRAEELRVTLDRLLGEHALLAIAATRKGYRGDRDFAASAAALDRNSVELANVIGSAYGRNARNEFLNGRFKWRAHIKFFVDYTVALKNGDRAGQRRAVNNLRGYIGSFSGFLASATGLPARAVRASITEHVMQLKGQLDAFARGRYAASYRLERAAYRHMFMTGDTLAAAIAKQKFN